MFPNLIILIGKPNDQTLIDGKWESLALAPVNDPSFPNDYFLFTVVSPIFLFLTNQLIGNLLPVGQ